jgi:pimeloyl-ACP methyl ester carboxylesterase
LNIVTAVAIVAALALLLVFHALRRWARGFLRPRGWKSARTPTTLGREAEPLEIDRGGAQLRGWFLRAAPGPRPTVIVAHGWNSHAGDMLLLAAPVVRAGYHAVVYDALGHGESDASEYTSLRHMRDDLETVLDWTLARADAAPGVALFGHSMGGAAAILVAARRDAVRALVCAGAPTDPLEITVEFLDGRGLPGRLIVKLLLPFWRPIVRESYPSLIPEARIAELRIPVLVLHGREDRQVAPSHAERLAARAQRGRLVLLEGAGHMDLHDHARYTEVVTGFLADAFGGDATATGFRGDLRPGQPAPASAPEEP